MPTPNTPEQMDEPQKLRAILYDAFGLETAPDGRPNFLLIRDEAGTVLEGTDYTEELDQAVAALTDMLRVDENTSDGYHTFKELYRYRLLYNAAFFNELFQTKNYGVHKSKRHSDRTLCFGGGWFIVAANLPTGQISNHYELKDWDLFQVEARATAVEWDGHTPENVAERLEAYLKLQAAQKGTQESE